MAVGSDDLCKKLIETTKNAEVLGWLESSDCSLGVMSHRDSVLFVEQAYKTGAKSIIAVEIADYDGSNGAAQNTGRICVELPDDAGNREEVFRWATKVAREQGFDGEEDEGQQYIFLMLD